MKKYTFSFPKNNAKDIYKEKLMNRVINAYPWMIEEKKEEPKYDMYVTASGNWFTDAVFCSSMEWLGEYAKHNSLSDEYDFEDIFGTPIKIFNNFVQIGYDIIPIAPGSLNHLKKETKKTVLEILIKIKYLRQL